MERIEITPLISEKSADLVKLHKYTLYVKKELSKIEIRNWLQKEYKIKIKDINTCIHKGKKRRRGRIVGKLSDRKKVVVTVAGDGNFEEIKRLF